VGPWFPDRVPVLAGERDALVARAARAAGIESENEAPGSPADTWNLARRLTGWVGTARGTIEDPDRIWAVAELGDEAPPGFFWRHELPVLFARGERTFGSGGDPRSFTIQP